MTMGQPMDRHGSNLCCNRWTDLFVKVGPFIGSGSKCVIMLMRVCIKVSIKKALHHTCPWVLAVSQ